MAIFMTARLFFLLSIISILCCLPSVVSQVDDIGDTQEPESPAPSPAFPDPPTPEVPDTDSSVPPAPPAAAAADADADADAARQCIPNTLKISDKVTHRAPKLTIAHRGASYHLPEHTTAAYRLALELRADYIEPDLVATSDGELIALHTVDLNVTTNVEEIFSENRLWLSPTVNRTSYWTFNFTYEELQQLTVKQRLPVGRSQQFDGLFGIPRLTDVLHVLKHWNTVDLPLLLPDGAADPDVADSAKNDNDNDSDRTDSRRPTRLELNQAGVYIELKDAGWLKDDAGIDLVDLLFQHLQEHSELWDHLLPCYDEIRFDSYKVPGLVVQSFTGSVLQEVSERWKDVYKETIPAPPLILLVDHPDCWEDAFWFEVGNKWRDYIAGIGCEKECLLADEGKVVQDKAEEYNLVLHPWTERPEQKYVSDRFDNALEETLYLFCESGAQGIFAESIHTALLAAELGCDGSSSSSQSDGGFDGSPTPAPVSSSSGSNNANQQGEPGKCSEQQEESSQAIVGLASFVAGAVLAAGLAVYMSSRRRRLDGRVVPTGERDMSYEPYDLEMT
jgi:glycerophosphoryl diester phosphodiesterase